MKTSLISASIGIILALSFSEYHNSHVSIWTGGYYIKPIGFLIFAWIGGAIGAGVGAAIDYAGRHDKEHTNATNNS